MSLPLVHNDIYVKKSKIHGYGVFAGKDIKQGETIEECYSLVSEFGDNALNNYYFKIKDDDSACLPLGYGAIFNHSHYPNASYRYDSVKEVMTYTAKRLIKKDEEIFISYGNHWFSTRKLHQKEISWRYRFKQIKPSLMRLLRFTIVVTLLFGFIRFKFF